MATTIGSGSGCSEIAPNDDADLPKVAQALYAPAAGTICAIGSDGAEFKIPVPANFTLRVMVKRFKKTGTTVPGNIFAIWA